MNGSTVKKIIYDVDKIKSSVKPLDFVRANGIPFVRKGNSIFIRCPDHEERTNSVDRHIGNCILNDTFNGAYYCFGCGARGSLFELIAKTMELDMKKDFGKICAIAADSYGEKQYFEKEVFENKNGNSQNSMSKKNQSERLKADQLAVIGILPSNYPSIVVECFDSKHNTDYEGLMSDVNYDVLDKFGLPKVSYLNTKGFNYSASMLDNDDPAAYNWFIKTKAKDAMEKYRSAYNKNWYQIGRKCGFNKEEASYYEQNVKNYFKSKYIEAKSILKLFASEDEINDVNDAWLFGYDFFTEIKPGSIL
mgnify:CR=1 FL=1